MYLQAPPHPQVQSPIPLPQPTSNPWSSYEGRHRGLASVTASRHSPIKSAAQIAAEGESEIAAKIKNDNHISRWESLAGRHFSLITGVNELKDIIDNNKTEC